MNAQAQMSGQASGRVPTQVGSQMAGLPQQRGAPLPSQMHNPVAMDAKLLEIRGQNVRKIIQILQKKSYSPHAEWMQRVPELAMRLEDRIFKDIASKDDYMSLSMAAIEQRLHAIPRNMSNNSHSRTNHIQSPSSISTMIPTPGMGHSGNMSSVVSSSANNSIVATGGAGMAAQSTINLGNSLATTNGSAGLVPNRYQQSPATASLGSGGSSIMSSIGMSQQLSQMIPTPGLTNPQSLPENVESSNGVRFSSVESTMVSQKQQQLQLQQQQQQQYVGNQNSRMLHTLGSQIGVASRSNLQQKSSRYGVSNGSMNGGLGLIGNNMHLVGGPSVSEGFMNPTTYGSSTKSMKQQFDQQYHQPILQASLPQQMLPTTVDVYARSSSNLSVSENLYDSTSSAVSSVSNRNVNPMSLLSKSKTNHALVTHNDVGLQPIKQPPNIKSEIHDNSQKMNFHSLQYTQEHLLQSQDQVQNFQKQSNQSYGHLVQHQHQQHQQDLHPQQLMQKTGILRQSSSSFGPNLLSEHMNESHDESIFPHSSEQFHLSELQSQYQQGISVSNHSRTVQLLGNSVQQDFQPTFSQDSQQLLNVQQQTTEPQNGYSCLNGPQPDVLQQGHWQPQLLHKPHMVDRSSFEQNIQDEFKQRVTGQEEAQQPQFKDCRTGPSGATQSLSVPQLPSGMKSELGNTLRDRNYHRQRRWLLFMRHARCCPYPKGRCKEVYCLSVQQLVMHMDKCTSDQCGYPRCSPSKKLNEHYLNCRAADCPVCVFVRNFVASNRKRQIRYSEDQMNESCRAINVIDADSAINKVSTSLPENSEDPESVKRMKVQHTYPLVPKRESSEVSVPTLCQPHPRQDVQPQLVETAFCKSEAAELKIDSSRQGSLPIFGNKEENLLVEKPSLDHLIMNDFVSHAKQEPVLVEKENGHIKLEVKQEENPPTTDPVTGSKSGKPKIKGVSLTELFTPEQIREHILSLRQWVGQSKAKAEKNQAMEHSINENSCQLCAVEKLTFEPPPIYCTPCGARIKRNATYYTMGTGDTRHYFCVACYNEARGDIDVEGSVYPKAKLDKKKNDEETEEWWVQCDKCEAWQHQICALFNGRRNDGGQAEYTCPNCCIEEIENGERKPLPQSAVLGAKDLPRTILSDHIEQRLFKRLKQERLERARHFGKSFDEVPGAEALVVRVVSSVDKKLEVKQRFLEIFQEENYPTEYPYKSKVVLLFQKIEGVEVCLFGMYVQEFGTECQLPNQRRVYLSYLDSVKYFRPEIRTVSGEALRTFVYHEILIGYLEYCKKRGFTSCYIWACPPLKGEDYILYCHPEIQKTPKSDKLREWYLAMLRKASKENVVVDLTNLYDHFFLSHGECKAKVTAARLPYFDGDYWPGAAEDMIDKLRQEEDGRMQQNKGKTKKALTKRALKAAGQTDLTGNASKDALLMQKLGETISPMKEDFIMVHLQHACNHCCLLMASGTRWVCNQCKNFQLCDRCRDAEQRLEERERHPINSREKHVFLPVEITDVPSDTKDKDEILESEFFDTRQAFLSLCQGNHYQYDTLRRAKHSSMMVLYHLHNPTAPAFVTTCNACHHDIETGQGWRCEICPDFDVCNACYQKDGGVDHPHKLTNHPSTAERDAQNQEARQKRVLQLRKMLDLLVHASQCRFPHCQYPNCRKVKGLFRHGIQCKRRASGGCHLCKKMWYLLQLHARACKESDCHVPRCKDLKEHLKRLQQQSDSRRRAAVMEMMRQRAAEVTGSTD